MKKGAFVTYHGRKFSAFPLKGGLIQLSSQENPGPEFGFHSGKNGAFTKEVGWHDLESAQLISVMARFKGLDFSVSKENEHGYFLLVTGGGKIAEKCNFSSSTSDLYQRWVRKSDLEKIWEHSWPLDVNAWLQSEMRRLFKSGNYAIYKGQEFRLVYGEDRLELISRDPRDGRHGLFEWADGFFLERVSKDDLDLAYSVQPMVLYQGFEFSISGQDINEGRVEITEDNENIAERLDFYRADKFYWAKSVHLSELEKTWEHFPIQE